MSSTDTYEDIWKSFLSRCYLDEEKQSFHILYGEYVDKYPKCTGCNYMVSSNYKINLNSCMMLFDYLPKYINVSGHCPDCSNLSIIKEASDIYNSLKQEDERRWEEKEKASKEEEVRAAEKFRLDAERTAREKGRLLAYDLAREDIFKKMREQEEEWLKHGEITFPICHEKFLILPDEVKKFIRKIFLWFEKKDIQTIKFDYEKNTLETIYHENRSMSIEKVNYNGTSYGVPTCMYDEDSILTSFLFELQWNGKDSKDYKRKKTRADVLKEMKDVLKKKRDVLNEILDYLTCKITKYPDFSCFIFYPDDESD
jgi:hypothetical protein